MRGSKQEITCACGCGRKKMVRTADVKRGWGKYYSKRCKAVAQCRRIGRPDLDAARERERMPGDSLIELLERKDADTYLHPMEDANFSGEW
jgi:hypothetical protein